MTFKTAARVLAALDLASAVLTFRAACSFWDAGQQEENVGVGLIAFALLGGALAMGAVASALFIIGARATLPSGAKVGLVLLGLLPPAAVAPFALDAYNRSTTTVTLDCSNLHRANPMREVASFSSGYHVYFPLLEPSFGHKPDTRYLLRDAPGTPPSSGCAAS
jgi:RsiW-degrading membrane proteinase PrsW (M82 family)